MDIDLILEKMTLEEKAALCSGDSTWLSKAYKKYGIPGLFMANGSYGLIVSRLEKDVSFTGKVRKAAQMASTVLKLSETPLMGKVEPSTSFPCSTAIACTWNPDLVFEIGKALGEECNRNGVDILLGPGINIKRTPLCGRNFEYYSEDPCLTGEIGAAFINGVQGEGVGVSLKHFALNNTELRRFTVDTVIDERTLREIYLAAFERIIKKSKPLTIMSAYNKVNGQYASENAHLLGDILRREWGFAGVVMSDWGAIEDRVKALNAGCDLQMPGPKPLDDEKIVKAVQTKEIDVRTLNASVRRILELADGLSKKKNTQTPDYEKHHELAVRVAEEGIVLLKNKGLLPLDPQKIGSLAVIGEAAKTPNYLKGGSAYIIPTKMDEPLEILQRDLGGQIKICYAQGYDDVDSLDEAMIEEAARAASDCAYALIIARTGKLDYMEGNERKDIALPEQQIRLIREVAKSQPNTVVAVICGSAFEVAGWEENIPSVLSLWHAGQGIGRALCNILFGHTNPSGRLAETFPIKLSDTPAFINMSMNNDKICYGENIFVGYRYYDKRKMKIAYPFGHGLSYTEFAYSSLSLEKTGVAAEEGVCVRLKVKNTGKYPGGEVVQLYIRDTESFLPRPEKELKAFSKIFLDAGEEKEVAFMLEKRDLSYYCPEKGWVSEEGEFEILIGASSRDIRLTERFYLQSGDKLQHGLNGDSFLIDWLSDARGRELIKSEMGGMVFSAIFDPNSPFYPLVSTFPLRRMVNNNLLTPKQFDHILDKLGRL